jgi:hypothetical protein
MASNASQLSRFLARTAGCALVLAGVVAFASVATAADPADAALVESISGNSSGVEFMDYLRPGQVIRLAPHETIVLSSRTSCVRETITGGTVSTGIDRSLVQSGARSEGFDTRCETGKMVLTGGHSEIAGRIFRGGPGSWH